MAHEIDMSNGRANFAYVGEHAWHGLGQQLSPDASLQVWEQEAGFNWEILQGPVCTPLGEAHGGGLLQMPTKQLLYRSDTLAPLAVVSDKYKVVQPKEVLHFYEDLIESAGFKLETAGMLFDGKKFWALAKTNYDAEVIPGDAVHQYLLLCTACDGSLATTAKFTSVRVVCNNTATMALAGKQHIKVPHSTTFDPNSVKKQLGIAGETFGLFMQQARQLANAEMSRQDAAKFLVNLVGDPLVSVEDQPLPAANVMHRIYALWDREGRGNELTGHTRWGMWNAVTEYYDWDTGHKTADARMEAAWFGAGDRVKTEAFELLYAGA